MKKTIYLCGIIGFYMIKFLTALTIATYIFNWEQLSTLLDVDRLMLLLFIYLTLASSGLKTKKS